jgi:hypothetical protein
MKNRRSAGAFGVVLAAIGVMLAAPACGKTESCVAKCERIYKECNPAAYVSGCAQACIYLDGACAGPFNATIECIEALPKNERCDATPSCVAEANAIISCCDANPNAAGCDLPETCPQKCERLTKECDPNADVSGCPSACADQDAALAGVCGAPFAALSGCIEALPASDRCGDGATTLCGGPLDAAVSCCTANPNAAGCGSGGSCISDSEACSDSAPCCSDLCASDGFCGCIPNGVPGCAGNFDCCSGFCDVANGVCS